MKHFPLLHPLLFAVGPILFLLAHNADQVDLAQGGVTLLVAALSAGVVFALARLLLADGARAALGTSMVAVLFYAYGPLFDVIWEQKWFAHGGDLELVLAGASSLVIVAGFFLLRRARANLRVLGVLLSLGGVSFIAMNVPILALMLLESPETTRAGLKRSTPPLLVERADRPDIYFLVLDGYARADVLRDLYGYDNSPFLDALRSRGFWVGERTRSAYLLTFMSLASTLSMRYLDDDLAGISAKNRAGKTKKRGSKRPPRTIPYAMIHEAEAARLLQDRGYRYLHFDTSYGGTERSDIADVRYSVIPSWRSSEFMSVFLRTTALRSFEADLAESHLYMLSTVQTVPQLAGPTFTFMHLIAPHTPYVFDIHGNVRADVPLALQFTETTGGWSAKAEYLEQLQYVNQRILEAVDRIVQDSPNPPVIIIESDHGSSTTNRKKMSREQSIAYWSERSANLAAFYAPEAVLAQLTDDFVPVNTFRILFSGLFGDELPPLEKQVWASSYDAPYDLENVTGLVDPPPAAEPVP